MFTAMTARFASRCSACALLLVLALAEQAQAQTPADQRMRMFEQHVALKDRSQFGALPWQFLGPTNISGRTADIAVVEPKGKSYTLYMAGASGGVWKTVNEGVTWEPVFEQGASTSIGDVTIAPSNSQIVWIGTGEANIFRSSMAGSGVYKSTDGGRTWAHLGLAGTHTIPRIVIHPQNPEIVYVAASGHEWTPNPERGVFKTTNGGRTWEKVLYVDENTGAIDLVLDPSNANTLYAATWQRVRKKWNDPRNEAGYTGSGIHKSTDGGATWKPINAGLPEARLRGRIGIDIARSQPNVLYAFVDNYDIARQPEEGATDAYGRPAGPVIRGATVYRSDDSGESWRQASETNQYMERLSATYGWVFGQIRVDPSNPNRIYVMGLGLHVSDDAGKTFRQLRGMHGDHHALWIDPANSDYLVNANDGGIYISYDAGANWRFMQQVPMVQFFNVAYDMGDPFRVYGSIQDHGSRRGVVDLRRGRHAIPAVDWENAPGGEGSNHVTDPRDPNLVYSAGFYGSISRTNVATNESRNIAPQPRTGELPLRGQWLAPFILSPHNPDVIYHGYQYVHRSMDRGDTWERISPDLTHNDPSRLGDIPFQTIFSLSESPLRFGLLYAGTDDGRLHVTQDGGKGWTEIGTTLPRDRFIAEIVASKYDEATVFVAQNGKRDDDFTPYIWKSADYGKTWTSIVANIPLGPVNVIEEDPKNANVLYVGTDVSVYVSVDAGRTWNVLATGLPSTFVADLVIHPRDDIMVAATHGRGMYAVDVRPIQKITPRVLAAAVHVLDPDPVVLPRTAGTGRGGGGAGGTARGQIYY
ncbi:MAG: WD40/YVTN/BNR-like repeat-containing protein, partial [Longimicrobiales bacterium]